MARRLLRVAVAALLLASSACRSRRAPPAAPSASASASASAGSLHDTHAIDGNAQNFFAEAELAQLLPGERASWQAYLERSAQRAQLDRALLERELAQLGQRE